MNKLSLLSYGVLLGASLVLSGCGGGGGSSGSKPALSQAVSSPAVSSVVSSSFASSSLPANIKLEIHGKAAAYSVGGGEVAFTIGAQTYKTQIDGSLNYSIALDIPPHDSYAPFTAIATGVGTEGWVQLAALYPSVALLSEKAGSDKVLNADEYFGVNITALTTAEYAEIINKQLPYATDAERKAALLSLHPIRAMEQAAMVSRLLTDVSIGLPAQAKTTLDYLLNANLAETYLESLRNTYQNELSNQIYRIQQDVSQSNLSGKKMIGKYFLEAPYSQYLLTFNEDGTGRLMTGSINSLNINLAGPNEVNASFTWVRKGSFVKLNFNDVVKYKVESVGYAAGQAWGCDGYSTSTVDLCVLSFDSMELEIITEADYRYIANLTIYAEAKRENDNVPVFLGAIGPQLAKITSASDASVVAATELIGSEWVSDKYTYVFTDNGKVTRKNLTSDTESTLSWTLENNHLVLDDAEFWLTHKEQGGFSIFYVDSSHAYRTSLFRRTVVTMAESDWVGRWNTVPVDASSYTYDVNADKTWRDGFEAQSAGSWAILTDHSQAALANASWRMIRDIVAIHDGKYYLRVCQGIEVTPFIPTDCYLSVQKKSIAFDTAIFWKPWSNPVFNEKTTQKPLVSMWGYLFVEDAADSSRLSFRHYVTVAPNKLFNSAQRTIVEMTSASANEIELCEYPLNQSCIESNKRKYERGIEVRLSIGAGGTVDHLLPVHNLDDEYFSTFRWSIDKIIMVPKGRAQVLAVKADAGYTIDTVSGCGGNLVGNEYYIPSLTNGCELAATFKKN